MALKSSSFVTSQEKFLIVLETYHLPELELYKYCLERGLYVGEVQHWQNNCLHANKREDTVSGAMKCQLQADKKRIKELEMDLTRTEKVLDDITALLMLSPDFANK